MKLTNGDSFSSPAAATHRFTNPTRLSRWAEQGAISPVRLPTRWITWTGSDWQRPGGRRLTLWWYSVPA